LVHQQHDVAVIPSIGSEGTALSAIEAMAAGCAVIASDVGGLPNVIINGWNGLLISPESEALYGALKLLHDDRHTRRALAENAISVAYGAFSKERWERQWAAVIGLVSST